VLANVGQGIQLWRLAASSNTSNTALSVNYPKFKHSTAARDCKCVACKERTSDTNYCKQTAFYCSVRVVALC